MSIKDIKSENQIFTRVPNVFIYSNPKEFNKKIILTYIYLDQNRTLSNVVNYSLYDLIQSNGYVCNGKAVSIIKQFKSSLEFLYDNSMIEFITPYKNIKGNFISKIQLLDNFDCCENFTQITKHEIDTLIQNSRNQDRSILFSIYLYIKSFMFQRPLTFDGEEYDNAKDKPVAFWGTYRTIEEKLGYAKNTITSYLNQFVEIGLLQKYETGSYPIYRNSKQIYINAPNIYVLNNENADQEIQWALDRLKQIHRVDKFSPMINKKNKNNKGEN